MSRSFPIAIIGGGPVGMAAAAHLVKRNKSFILIEKGKEVGPSLLQWKHVRLFSPWEYTIDRVAEELLVSHGWTSPPKEELPTGGEMVRDYLQPLAQLPEIKPHIITGGRVVALQRYGIDKMKTKGRETFPFEVIYEKDGETHQVFASGVIDATGTWETPNPAGASGNIAIGENNNKAHIYYGIPEATGVHRSRYAGKVVAVVGSGHSAINSLLELDRLKEEVPETKILWVLRKKTANEAYGGGEDDALPARGALGTKARLLVKEGRVEVHSPFRIDRVKSEGDKLQIKGLTGHQTAQIEGVDEIIVNTGARPDFSYHRELRYQADHALESVPALAELIDPNVHSCGTVRAHGEAELRQPEKNFYIVGSKSYGRAPTFLMATGYEQVRSIAAAFAGDWEASLKVELQLPETGVCGVPES
ncbi:NAD(P)-binding domain-containing protein [Gracilibacillus kekensis]|uniref:Predicted flavoprotein CzcO associated with the cation diffusion facilitator CzcD n=1 Tax=Gracilibacillus kekensis TaxID=1027249 RepID=A0A1M7LAS2_9BACI|nr:NAD(P)-binding domain-containing protein [Gracilibacillus kekensis]SHM75099.1 Predicted flavoprotein CzcO associated with the cation diffusion facilitator CzcD [Gracilibacillus kekensis]